MSPQLLLVRKRHDNGRISVWAEVRVTVMAMDGQN
jgi:hypothetical protein